MKAFVTVIDDNGIVICKDKLLDPVKEGIYDSNPYQIPVKETRYSFVIKQMVDFQLADFQNKEAEESLSIPDKLDKI